jgi:hypothetical protein
VAALEAELSTITEIKIRRAERARVQRERELDQVLAIGDRGERTRALQGLAPTDRRAAFARADLATLRRAVLDAPADVRTAFLADVPAHCRDAIEVHLVELPARVRITEAPAAPRTTRGMIEISDEQADRLARVGLRGMLSVRHGYPTLEPLDTRDRITVLDLDAYEVLVSIDTYLATQIDRGHLHVEILDDAANREHQLGLWGTVPRHMRDELPLRSP